MALRADSPEVSSSGSPSQGVHASQEEQEAEDGSGPAPGETGEAPRRTPATPAKQTYVAEAFGHLGRRSRSALDSCRPLWAARNK